VPAPLNLPAAFRLHAGSDPEEPWLFRAEGWDWIWHSWVELAGWMRPWTERLSSLPTRSRASFLYTSRPESVVLDLAIQAAGLVSAPASARGDGVWIEIEGGDLRISPSPEPVSRDPDSGTGGVVVSAGEEWTAAALVAAGERLREAIGSREEREIVVLGGPLESPVERRMLAWATLAGAAVVLEPNPALRPATAAWVRPTVFHGVPREIAELRSRVKERGGRLPFRRLRTVLVTGAERLATEDEAFWRGRGVRVGWI
jgi:hypothetical protein